jgi:hypothetical protein
MNEHPRDSARTLTPRRSAAVLGFFALNLAVYLIRIVSVWRYGALFCPTAAESPMIDSVWRCMNHRPVYTWPFTFPFSLSLYNYLFYHAYAAALTLIGAGNAAILTWGRQLTLLFALAGAVAQWRLVRALLDLRGARSALSLTLAVGLWLCTSLVKYWALVIRPDMAAAALAMMALWVAVRQPRFAFAYAGLLLYLAWAFKQSAVLTLAALCLWLAGNKRWRDLSLLAAVFATLAAATLLTGTPEYRFNILVAPSIVKGFAFGLPWIFRALGTGLSAIFLNLYWVAAPFVLLCTPNGQRVPSFPRPFHPGLRQGWESTPLSFSQINGLLPTVFAITLVLGIAGMGKVGGTSNYLFEAFVAGSTLLQLAVFTIPGRWVTALVLFGCIQPAVQIVSTAIGYHHPGKRDRIVIATAAEFAQAVDLRDRLATMKKPIFTTDEAFQIPWYSAENGAPVFAVDPNFQEAARAREENGGIEGLLQRGEIPTVLLAPNDLVYLKSLNPHYRKVGESLQQEIPYSIYEFDTGPALSAR